MTCPTPGCGRSIHANGLCAACNQREYRKRAPAPEPVFRYGVKVHAGEYSFYAHDLAGRQVAFDTATEAHAFAARLDVGAVEITHDMVGRAEDCS